MKITKMGVGRFISRSVVSLFLSGSLGFSFTASYGEGSANNIPNLEGLSPAKALEKAQSFRENGLIFRPLNNSDESREALRHVFLKEFDRGDKAYQPELGYKKTKDQTGINERIAQAVQLRIKKWGDRAEGKEPLRCFLVFEEGKTEPKDVMGYVNIGCNSIADHKGRFKGTLEGGAKFIAEASKRGMAVALRTVFQHWVGFVREDLFSPSSKLGGLFIYTVSPGAHLNEALSSSGLQLLRKASEGPVHAYIRNLLKEGSRGRFKIREEDGMVLEKVSEEDWVPKLVYFTTCGNIRPSCDCRESELPEIPQARL